MSTRFAERGHVVSRTRSTSGKRTASGIYVVEYDGEDFHGSPGARLATLQVFPPAVPAGYVVVVRDAWMYCSHVWTSGTSIPDAAASMGTKSANGLYADNDSLILSQALDTIGHKGMLYTDKGEALAAYKTLPLGIIGGGDTPLNLATFVTVTVDAGAGHTTNEFTNTMKLRVFVDYIEIEPV